MSKLNRNFACEECGQQCGQLHESGNGSVICDECDSNDQPESIRDDYYDRQYERKQMGLTDY